MIGKEKKLYFFLLQSKMKKHLLLYDILHVKPTYLFYKLDR